MHLRSRPNRYPIWYRVTNHTGLELDLRLHHFTVLDELLDIEYCKGLSDGDEECIVGYVAAGADAAAEAEDEVTWVRFCFVGRAFEEAFGAEGHGLGIDGRVVGEPPIVLLVISSLRKFHQHGTNQVLGNSKAPFGIL